MNNHVFRPLFVFLGLVLTILAVRLVIVPKDFGVWERGYMYGFHRKSNEDDWKAFKVKYQFNNAYCKDCHSDNYDSMNRSPHGIIPCEDCHSPVLDHPSEPAKLSIDKSRVQCLRCHYLLKYPTSGRANIRGIDPETHNPDIECATCHNPHKPGLEALR